jgi:hypothetical protein
MTFTPQGTLRWTGAAAVVCLGLCSSESLAQPVQCDDPNPICDVEILPAPPLPAAAPAPAPQVVYVPMMARPARPPFRLSVHIGATSGVTAFALLDETSDAAAFVGADVRLLWSRPGSGWAIGARFAASGVVHGPDDFGQVITGSASFLMNFSGFWLSGGLAVDYFGDWDGDGVTLPALALALGYDIPLGRHLALRLEASGSTLLVINHGSLGAGIVARF